MNEYRCTRSDFYRARRCTGWSDTSAREGHYVRAGTHEEARRKMHIAFPTELEFSVELTKENVK